MPLRYWYLVILALCGFVTSFGAHIVATNLPPYAETVGVGALMIGLLIAVYDFAEITLVAEYFATGRGKAFGIYNALKGAGYVIAPALGGFLIHGHGFAMIFIVSAAVGVAALLLSLFLPPDRSRKVKLEDDDDDMSFKGFLLIFRERRLLPIYGVIVVNMFLAGILFGFLPVYLYSIGYTPLESGATVSIATASYLLVQPFAGHLADRVSIRATVLLGLLLAALAITMLTFTTGPVLVAVAVLAGVGVGTVWTNSDTLVSTMVEQKRLGAGMGAAQSFKEFGDMVGPLLVGLITQLFGVQAGFVSCGALALVLLLVLWRSQGGAPA